MWLRLGCEFEYAATHPTPSLWQIRVRPDGAQRLLEEEWSAPARATWYLDSYANVCDRVMLPSGASVVRYDALAEVSGASDQVPHGAGPTAIEDLPDEAFVYLLPSRYCWPDVLHDEAWRLFGDTEPGWPRVEAVSTWVHTNIRYEMGATTAATTAIDVYASRVGVCRDFTQLGMTLCRALNIPARYISGYLPDIGVDDPVLPMDFASWFEVWLDGSWWTVDPRNNVARIGRVVIARGRDALDAAMVTTWGGAELLRMGVWTEEMTGAE
jgi:transglutaminase-like putative cysteine protease